MKNLRVAGRYAKSLIDLAIERNQLEEVEKDMETLRELAKVRDFAMLLKSPVVPPAKKRSILETILEGRVGEMTNSFVRILVNKGRESDLIDIADSFQNQYRDIKHISAVKVTSAKPLDAATLKQIERQLIAAGKTESQIEFTTKVDPELIGGFIIEFDGKVYDASVAHKLNQLRKDFDQPNVYISQIDAS
ncbi:MAG: ATP synthase F1 subunit delta [Bacteroidota bacterium]